jgi:rod shape-determining protein MreD
VTATARGLLLLPGEAPRSGIRLHRAVAALAVGFLWLLVESATGLGGMPLDPLLPLLAASALAGRRVESWVLAIGLGLLADFFSGVPSGRPMLQYAFVVGFGLPLHGRVILRDRWVPVLGVALLGAVSGGLVLLFVALMGGGLVGEGRALAIEVMGTAAATALFWPIYRRVAGWQDDRSFSGGAFR